MRLLTSKDVSLIMRGRLYSSCVRSSMLHGSETWPVRKENVVALQRAVMRMVMWMCSFKLKDRLPSKELRERLGVDDIALTLQQNRLCYTKTTRFKTKAKTEGHKTKTTSVKTQDQDRKIWS